MTGLKRNNKILRSQYNEGFIFKHGFCPAGKWKMPKEGQSVKVPGIFKPHFNTVKVDVKEVVVSALKGNLVLKDAETGQEIPVLPRRQRQEIFQRQMKSQVPVIA